jgi:hypothetical protein
LVPGQRFEQLGGEPADLLADPLRDVVGGLVVEADQHPQPGGSFDQCRHLGGAVCADDQVAFPVAGHGSVLDFGRTLGDHHHVRDRRTPRLDTATRPASGPAAAQTGSEFLAQLRLGLHENGLIDRLMGHPPLWVIAMVSA